MATKSGNKGRYICKVGYLDVYAKDTYKPADVKATVYNVLHAKRLVKGNFKTKDEAVNEAIAQMGDKAVLYGLI